jgi:hypothetical protein
MKNKKIKKYDDNKLKNDKYQSMSNKSNKYDEDDLI